MFSNLGTAPPRLTYPYEAWSIENIRIAELAIHVAWSKLALSTEGTQILATGTEPQITAALRDIIEDILNDEVVPGFTPAVFGRIPRGQEMDDYSGKFFEKRPDLTFQVHASRPAKSHNALFFECKMLGKGRTLKDYAQDGIRRFVDGRYAWCMPHAGMIAYVADSTYSTDTRLELASFWNGTSPLSHCAPVGIAADTEGSPVVAVTVHARTFTLRNSRSPGMISLRHLWLGT
jgi:hypothetical protein